MKNKNVKHILLKSRQGSRFKYYFVTNPVLDYINNYGLNRHIFMSGDATLKALIDRVIYHYKKDNTNTESILFNVVKDLINHKIQ